MPSLAKRLFSAKSYPAAEKGDKKPDSAAAKARIKAKAPGAKARLKAMKEKS